MGNRERKLYVPSPVLQSRYQPDCSIPAISEPDIQVYLLNFGGLKCT